MIITYVWNNYNFFSIFLYRDYQSIIIILNIMYLIFNFNYFKIRKNLNKIPNQKSIIKNKYKHII